jgi:hypothetical protein
VSSGPDSRSWSLQSAQDRSAPYSVSRLHDLRATAVIGTISLTFVRWSARSWLIMTAYMDPRLVNDRLLLALKGTMSEYELSLLRQRGIAARDSKARRGELRFALPPGDCWNEVGQIEMEPDERVADAIRLLFRKFRELGSARQVLLWAMQSEVKLPVTRRGAAGIRIEWSRPAYHTVVQILEHSVDATDGLVRPMVTPNR